MVQIAVCVDVKIFVFFSVNWSWWKSL